MMLRVPWLLTALTLLALGPGCGQDSGRPGVTEARPDGEDLEITEEVRRAVASGNTNLPDLARFRDVSCIPGVGKAVGGVPLVDSSTTKTYICTFRGGDPDSIGGEIEFVTVWNLWDGTLIRDTSLDDTPQSSLAVSDVEGSLNADGGPGGECRSPNGAGISISGAVDCATAGPVWDRIALEHRGQPGNLPQLHVDGWVCERFPLECTRSDGAELRLSE